MQKRANRTEMLNRTFGKWFVFALAPERVNIWRNKKQYKDAWFVRCACERKTEKVVLGQSLRSNRSLNCGCGRRATCSRRPYESLYNFFKSNADSRSLNCTITYEDFLCYTRIKECFYCGCAVTWGIVKCGSEGNRYNLDRKDNALPYTSENVVVCCKRCNYGKGRYFSFDEWVVMTAALRAFSCSQKQ